MARIIICDDDAVDRSRLLRLALRAGVAREDAHCVSGLNDLLAAFEQPTAYDLVILDDRLIGLRAEQSLRKLRAAAVTARIVVVTSDLPPGRREVLLGLGAMDCIAKDDIDAERIAELIAMARVSGQVLRVRAPTAWPVGTPLGRQGALELD